MKLNLNIIVVVLLVNSVIVINGQNGLCTVYVSNNVTTNSPDQLECGSSVNSTCKTLDNAIRFCLAAREINISVTFDSGVYSMNTNYSGMNLYGKGFSMIGHPTDVTTIDCATTVDVNQIFAITNTQGNGNQSTSFSVSNLSFINVKASLLDIQSEVGPGKVTVSLENSSFQGSSALLLLNVKGNPGNPGLVNIQLNNVLLQGQFGPVISSTSATVSLGVKMSGCTTMSISYFHFTNSILTVSSSVISGAVNELTGISILELDNTNYQINGTKYTDSNNVQFISATNTPQGAKPTLSNTTFFKNQGTLITLSNAQLTMDNCIFSANDSPNGTIVSVTKSQLQVSNGHINLNTGTIFTFQNSQITLQQMTVFTNYDYQLFNCQNSNITVTNITMEGNTDELNDSQVSCQQCQYTDLNSDLDLCTATSSSDTSDPDNNLYKVHIMLIVLGSVFGFALVIIFGYFIFKKFQHRSHTRNQKLNNTIRQPLLYR
ncbi:hypothetical protein DLAC_08958 [Tieghemostelium lacteum]|uniref:Transmembrane protein n=1 Tax=Tieghemostelium lacteum TaxID=361077 RepID=A0A151Z910_TIELA|nr:hypothetical protein DLAC_08958 [Tieghemostelium lacteum]|eukprot:KYQ90344.1 hypothetical protein DLAC_08958 [Tieghemostelium lacteum]